MTTKWSSTTASTVRNGMRDRLEREALNPAADAGKCIVCGNNVQGSQGRSNTESRLHHMVTQGKDYPRSAAYEAF